MIRNLYDSVTIGGTSLDVTSINISEGYKQTCARCTIEVEDIKDVGLNDQVSVDLGYDTDHKVLFTGFVDEITYVKDPGIYMIESRDALKLALEHWLVTTDIENPWSRSNISAEDLVHDLLNESQIFTYTTYSGDTTSFTFGTQHPAEFNLMSSWDAVRTINHILAYNCFERDEVIYFTRILPEPAASKTSDDHIINIGNTGNLVFIDYSYSTDNLRNRVVVFGRDGIYAEASAESPYLPSTPDPFYKTAIVSSELIDTQTMADGAADYNLQLYNRLTEASQVNIEGNTNIRVYDTVEVTEPSTGMENDLWFVYSATHTFSTDGGYTLGLSLTK